MQARHLNQIELSRRWNISHRTLERWRSIGEGPAFLKLGGRVLYRREDIEAFEDTQLRRSKLVAQAVERRARDARP
jgi:predicted site-specific integrase-resolvase